MIIMIKVNDQLRYNKYRGSHNIFNNHVCTGNDCYKYNLNKLNFF